MDTLLTSRVDKQNGKRVLYAVIIIIIFKLNIALRGTTHCHIPLWVQAAQPSLVVPYMLSSQLPQAQTHGTKGFGRKRWRDQKP